MATGRAQLAENFSVAEIEPWVWGYNMTTESAGSDNRVHLLPFISGQDMKCKLCLMRHEEKKTKEQINREGVAAIVIMSLVASLILAALVFGIPRLWGAHHWSFQNIFFIGLGVCFLLVMWLFAFGQSRFVFHMDGHNHVHFKDPRRQLLPTGKFYWHAPSTEAKEWPAGSSVIEGPILRIRHFGWLTKLLYYCFSANNSYNGFLIDDSGDVDPKIQLTHSSTLEDCRFAGASELPWAVKDAGAMLDFIRTHQSLKRYMQSFDDMVVAKTSVEDLVLAIREYLYASRDRGQSSSVGRAIREMIEVSDFGHSFPLNDETSRRGRQMEELLSSRLASPSGQGTS